MTRRQALALLLVALLLAAGRALRHYLLVGPGGSWRDPLWLEEALPALPVPEEAAPPAVTLTGPVRINHCAADTLEALPGLGPVLVGRILAAREAGVVFTGPDDLQQIKGIGPRLASRLAPALIFSLAPAIAACESLPRVDPAVAP